MKRVLKSLLKVLLLLAFLFVLFYFWGSSGTLEKESYASLIKNEYVSNLKKDSVFSIVTYNIGYLSGMTNNKSVEKPQSLFENNLSTVLKEFKKVNPDIIAFQEIDYNSSRSYEVNQEKEVAQLGYNYTARAVNWDKKYVPFPYWPMSVHFGKIVSGQSILSKYPISNHERIVLERVADSPFYREAFYLDRLIQIVKVTIQGKEVMVINVHLEAFDKKTRMRQTEKVAKLFTEYAEKYPTILLGDFNSDPKNEDASIQKILALPNVGNAAFSKDNYPKTFDSRNPEVRLDYIFYTEKTIDYVSGRVLNELGESSDHLPVEMKFKLK